MTKMIPALKNYSYHRRLQELHLTTLQERHTRQDLITVYNMFKVNIGTDPDKYCEMEDRHRTRGNVIKIKPRYTRLEVRRNTFLRGYGRIGISYQTLQLQHQHYWHSRRILKRRDHQGREPPIPKTAIFRLLAVQVNPGK